MENLAGNPTCDMFIERELQNAGIRLVKGKKQRGEVPATVTGALGAFRFMRAWRYWIAEGDMPLEAAKALYADSIGKIDVRVAGHAGCPPPESPWVEWRDNKGRRIFPMSKKPKYYSEKDDGYQIYFDDPSKVGMGFIPLYHIDTDEGLKLFASIIRKYQLF